MKSQWVANQDTPDRELLSVYAVQYVQQIITIFILVSLKVWISIRVSKL